MKGLINSRISKTLYGLTPDSWPLTIIILILLLIVFAPTEREYPQLLPGLIRVAVAGFNDTTGKHKAAVEAALAAALGRDTRVELIERARLLPALAGIGYDGSLNLSRDEARSVGAAIGCDFFIIGKVDVTARSERPGESHQEAIIGVMIVDGRTGELALFNYIIEKAKSPDEALIAAARTLTARAQGYVDYAREFQAARRSKGPVSQPPDEIIEELPDEASPRAVGFTQPVFTDRAKPAYTEEADRANISASVEVTAVFLASGEVGETAVTRWAGFGLDESAVAAVRHLKFKPATRDGEPVSVRAMIRYNFRKKTEAEPAAAPAPQPPAVPQRDLRELFKQRRRPL